MARANGHWRAFDGKTPALAVFSGPHAYVSARWYPSARQVPTWNYVAVHATGRPRVIADPTRVFALLRGLMAAHERALPDAARGVGKGPRELADIPFAHLDRLVRGIVAFELPIETHRGQAQALAEQEGGGPPPDRQGLRAAGGADALDDRGAIEAALGGEGS